MKSSSRLLLLALLAGLILRVALVALPAGVPLRIKAVESVGDAREYLALAGNLARHHVFSRDSVPPYRPELFRTPVYPLLLALPVSLPGSPLVAGLALQLLLALAAIWLAHRLALELGLERPAADAVALLVALSPNLAFLSSKLISEPLFAVLLLACILLVNRFVENRRSADIVAAGVVSGLMMLTRPIATFFPLVLAAWLFWLVVKERRMPVWLPLVPLACASIVVLPWVVRNGHETGRYVVSTASDHNTYLYTAATVLASDEGISIADARDTMMSEARARYASLDSNDEASFWRALATVGRQHIRKRPFTALKVTAIGFVGNFCLPVSLGPLLIHSGAAPGGAAVLQTVIGLAARGRFGPAIALLRRARLEGITPFAGVWLVLAGLFNLILLAGAIAGLCRGRAGGRRWLLLPVLYFTLSTGVVGDARFRAPVEPLIAVFAALALFAPRRLPVRQTADK